jgi:hypothetical protein
MLHEQEDHEQERQYHSSKSFASLLLDTNKHKQDTLIVSVLQRFQRFRPTFRLLSVECKSPSDGISSKQFPTRGFIPDFAHSSSVSDKSRRIGLIKQE